MRAVWEKDEKEMSRRLMPEYQYVLESGHFHEPDFVKVRSFELFQTKLEVTFMLGFTFLLCLLSIHTLIT